MTEAAAAAPQHTALGRLLDFIERAGNKVPHPVMMFLYLIIGVIVLSAVLAFAGVSVTDEIAVPNQVRSIRTTTRTRPSRHCLPATRTTPATTRSSR